MGGVEDEIWEEDESGEWRSRRDWSRFKPAKRIPVEDGLELRSRRGAIGESWWSRRFLSAIESILTGGRLTRGRTYARQGQVIDLGIGSGLVVAQVQGSRRTPYGVQISMPAASDMRWEAIVDALAAQAGYAARLLAGELPHEIEDVFAEAGVALFPERGSHLTTSCTCPDWATPCKHAAAVCYLMAEAFDDDPFLLLAFRGREREALLDELRDRRGLAVDDGGPSGTASPSLAPPRAPRRWPTRSPPFGVPAPGWPRCTASPGPRRHPARCCACCRGACWSCGARRSPTFWSPPTPASPPPPRGGPSGTVRPPGPAPEPERPCRHPSYRNSS